jgi:signal transduction histidine kinase
VAFRVGYRSTIRATLRNTVWLAILVLIISALFFITFFAIPDSTSILVRIVAVLSGATIAVVSSAFLLVKSPMIRAFRMQAKQFSAFSDAINHAAGILDLQQILDSAAEIILEITHVRGCSIKLLDTNTKKMKARSIVGLEDEAKDRALNMVEKLYHRGMMDRKPIIVKDILMREFPAVNDEFESLVCVPLQIEERVLGAICVFGKKGQRLSQGLISLLSTLGNVVSLAIAHALVYDEMLHLVEVKTRFMFQASHELRSPLDTIQLMAKNLLDGYAGELHGDQEDLLFRILSRAQLLAETVNDLLTLATGRAELAKAKRVVIDFETLVEDGVQFFEAQAAKKNIKILLDSTATSPCVLGSEAGLRSVITNLISNAIKYTPPDGRVDIRIHDEEQHVVLEIEDTGIGIPKEDQGELFTEFFRATNAKTVSKVGTGLGLAIVKATVEQHGGSIEVASKEGEGTTFRICLNKSRRKLEAGT